MSTSKDTTRSGQGRDKKVEPLELFFDLVFVFALTQVTALMAYEPTGNGLVKGLLILTAIWWAWGAYAWLTNEVDTRLWTVRLAVFASMAAMLIVALAIPKAFAGDAVLFAVAYLIVRLLHILLFAAGTDNVDVKTATRLIAPSALIGPLLILTAAAFDGTAQILIWVLALTIDIGGTTLRGIDGWNLSASHFAERHGLIVIIALGESIVAIGVGASEVKLDAGALLATTCGIAVAAALWSTYFDSGLDEVEHRLEAAAPGHDRNTMARDSFSLLHLPMIAGIVLLALGVKKTLGHVDHHLELVPAIALCGGVALYLLADVAFRRRCLGRIERARIAAALVLLVLIVPATHVVALVSLAATALVCVALVVYEVRLGAA